MSFYVGIDVHRKRSQVAVIDQEGKVLAIRIPAPRACVTILSCRWPAWAWAVRPGSLSARWPSRRGGR